MSHAKAKASGLISYAMSRNWKRVEESSVLVHVAKELSVNTAPKINRVDKESSRRDMAKNSNFILRTDPVTKITNQSNFVCRIDAKPRTEVTTRYPPNYDKRIKRTKFTY